MLRPMKRSILLKFLLVALLALASAPFAVQAFQQPEGATGVTAKLLVTAKRQMVVAGPAPSGCWAARVSSFFFMQSNLFST